MTTKALSEIAPQTSLDLSVIISTFSIERYCDIKDILDHLNGQLEKSFESIVVVDCDVHYYEKLSEYLQKTCFCFKVSAIFNPVNKGLSYSRNVGVTNAIGRYVAFLDDDAVPEPQWTKEILDTFDDGVGAVTGDVLPLWESEKLSWFPKELYWMISCSYTLSPKEKMEFDRGFGVNMAFRRESVLRSGMFNESLGINNSNWVGGEDTEMFLKIQEGGEKVFFNPSARVYHKIPAKRVHLKSLVRRAYAGGISVALLKSVCGKYQLLNSTEHSYSKDLLYRFYPSSVWRCIRDVSITPLKRIFYVSLCSALVVLGYINQSLSIQLEDIKRSARDRLDGRVFLKMFGD